MNCLRFATVLVFISLFMPIKASVLIPYTKIPIDSSNITSYHDKLGLYFYSIRKFRTYALKSTNSGLKLKYEPNGRTNIGIGFNYKWMGLGLAVGIPYLNRDNAIYGETNRFDLQLNLFSRFFGINAYYQKYQGFYLSNPRDFLISNKNTFPTLNDMQCSSMGLSAFFWMNNHEFSYKAAYVRNEIQNKSAGGLILGVFADADVVYAPSGFIPNTLPDSLASIINFKGYSTYVGGISFGYAYTLKFFKHAFINISLTPGVGYRHLSIWNISSQDKIKPGISGSVKGKCSVGLETKHFYLGASSIGGLESFKYEEVDISSTSGQIRLYIGKRF
jgi:hypothetical protein